MDPGTLVLLKAIGVGGPLALVLAYAVRVLWGRVDESYKDQVKSNAVLQDEKAEALKNTELAAQLAKVQADHAAERTRWESTIETMRQEHRTDLKELIATLRELAEE